MRAKQELYEFLAENPKLISFQMRIERELEKAGDDPAARMMILARLIQDNLDELGTELKLLGYEIYRFADLLEKEISND